jgi:hypothetical protein
MDDIYKRLNALRTLEEQKPLLREHFSALLQQHKSGDLSEHDLAYSLAGLMQLKTADGKRDDPYVRVMELGGQLELPQAQRQKGATWEELETAVLNLP